jgi:hypothetical protein
MHTIAEVAVGLVAAGTHIDAAVVEDYSFGEATHIVIAEATV